MPKLTAFETAIISQRVVDRVTTALSEGEVHLAKTFSTPGAMQEYLKAHPKANPSKHSVKEKGPSAPKPPSKSTSKPPSAKPKKFDLSRTQPEKKEMKPVRKQRDGLSGDEDESLNALSTKWRDRNEAKRKSKGKKEKQFYATVRKA
jgi:hypothetical protein